MNNNVYPNLPLVTNPYEDLIPQTDVDHNGADSWFLVAHTKNESNHEYTFLIHTLQRGVGDSKATVCITDITGDNYISDIVSECNITSKKDGVEFKSSNLTWDLHEQTMKVHAIAQGGKYVIELAVKGDNTVFGYNTNGIDPVFGKEVQNVQYSFPNLEIKGTFIIDDITHEVSGEGWFDRQWGPLPFAELLKGNANWLWIAGKLDNGYNVTFCSTVLGEKSFDWVTALSPEGVYTVAPILKSVINSSKQPWVSKESGKQWFSSWNVDIPSIGTELEIKMTNLGQEIFCKTDKLPIPNIEAVVKMEGTFQNKPVTGKGFIEIVS